jgi:hypothetical protein
VSDHSWHPFRPTIINEGGIKSLQYHVPSEWLERIWRCGPKRLALDHIERELSKA